MTNRWRSFSHNIVSRTPNNHTMPWVLMTLEVVSRGKTLSPLTPPRVVRSLHQSPTMEHGHSIPLGACSTSSNTTMATSTLATISHSRRRRNITPTTMTTPSSSSSSITSSNNNTDKTNRSQISQWGDTDMAQVQTCTDSRTDPAPICMARPPITRMLLSNNSRARGHPKSTGHSKMMSMSRRTVVVRVGRETNTSVLHQGSRSS